MKKQSSIQFHRRPKVKRPGIHAKSKSSKLKSSKNYSKKYNRQGHG